MTACRQLVLVGGGHAHVFVLEAFARRPLPEVELTLVVDRPVALYSGRVPAWVAGRCTRRALELPLEPLAARAGARTRIARATGLDVGTRRVLLEDGDALPYDLLSLDVGSSVAGLDAPGVRAHALTSRPMDGLVDRAAQALASARRVVVVGGGAAGVELAFCAQARAGAEVVLIEAGGECLPGFPPRLRRLVARRARDRGIALRTGARAVALAADHVRLADGEALSCDLALWSPGPAPHPWLARTGLATRQGWLRVEASLRTVTSAEVFAAGDCAAVEGFDHAPSGVHAVRQGPLLAHNLRACLGGGPLRRWRPQRDVLRLLDLGDGSAVGCKAGVTLAGRWVARWKAALDGAFVRRFGGGESPT